MSRGGRGTREGFTVIELLLVMAMLGMVTAAIYSTYLANQRIALSQGEVIELQQNLRVALDCLTRDLKMAGVLVPHGATPLAAASGSPPFPNYSSEVMINTASAEGRLARVEISDPPDDILTVSSTHPTTLQLTMELPGSAAAPNCVDGFVPGDGLRLIRPVDGSQPLTGTPQLKVAPLPNNPSRGVFGLSRPSIIVAREDGGPFTPGDVIRSSDMLAKVADHHFPMTVAYYLVQGGVALNGFTCPQGQKCLVRQVNGAAGPAEIIAGHISSLRFGYLDDSYHEAPTPSSLSSVRAVRVTLEGSTSRTALLYGGGRTRAVTTVVKLRNRR